MLAAVSSGDALLTYGPLGIGAVAMAGILRFLFNRVIAENDELRAQRELMIKTLLEVVPLMKQSTEIHEKRQQSDELTRSELRSLSDKVDRIARDLGVGP